MRNLAIAAGILALSAPAAAQPYPDEMDDEIVRDLPPPERIDEMGAAMDRMVGALMDIPVGGIAQAMEPDRRLSEAERRRTVRDMATRDDPYAEERMRGSIGAMTSGMGVMMEQVAVLAPVMRRSLAEMARSMEDAMRPYDRDWDE